MKTKIKGKVKGKATIGIAMAAIMLASVFVAMVLRGSAEPLPPESYSGLYNYIALAYGNDAAAVSVLIGQDIWLWGANNGSATIQGDPASDAVAGNSLLRIPQANSIRQR